MSSTSRRKLNKTARESLQNWGNEGFSNREARFPKARIGVAEGDSWFDYTPAWLEDPFKGDLLSRLMKTKRYNIQRVSDAGDTLENMVYGTDYPKAPQIKKTVKLVKKLKPEFFLFSGGGNDFSEEALESLLNHVDSGRSVIRSEVTNFMFGSYVPAAYEEMVRTIHAVDPNIHIFLHGYGNADPTGKAVVNAPFGWKFVGPWLRPHLRKKGITKQADQRQVIKTIVARFNLMLAAIAQGKPRVHHIDLRDKLTYGDWANELHLNKKGWAKTAVAFDEAIGKHLPPL